MGASSASECGVCSNKLAWPAMQTNAIINETGQTPRRESNNGPQTGIELASQLNRCGRLLIDASPPSGTRIDTAGNFRPNFSIFSETTRNHFSRRTVPSIPRQCPGRCGHGYRDGAATLECRHENGGTSVRQQRQLHLRGSRRRAPVVRRRNQRKTSRRPIGRAGSRHPKGGCSADGARNCN